MSRMADTLGQLMEAVNFAAIKHRDQRRKDPHKTPYINHPIGVAYILWKEGGVSDITVLQVSYIASSSSDELCPYMHLCRYLYCKLSSL